MSQDIKKYRNWIRTSEHARSRAIYFIGIAILEELGEKAGSVRIIKQVEEMGKYFGNRMKKTKGNSIPVVFLTILCI